MATTEILRPYVERTIASAIGATELAVHPNGDIPIREGSVVYIARLLEGPTGPMLNVYSPVLADVKKSVDLLETLNELNMNSPFVRFFWWADYVYCAMDLLAENLQAEEINNALGAVAWHADRLDEQLQSKFGGKRTFEEGEAQTEAPLPRQGQYL